MSFSAKTRFLLALWYLGGELQEVTKSQIHDKSVPKGEKVGDFLSYFQELETEGAIIISNKGYSLSIPKGLETLRENLKSPDFQFEGNNVGAWVANALLQWLRSDGTASTSERVNGAKSEVDSNAIHSYDQFKQITLDVYSKLNQNHNFDDLVPIYRIRREIGEKVSREHFNEWLLEMQANNIFQLEGGSLPDSDTSKIEDSVETEVSGLSCYAKRLN
ncbi:MAG: hypothetical protein HC908_17625 [Calothrix sp. SM1_7_51]|nr:hypothetical protein [Calothrix sp. SM1_7_51]